MSTSALNVGQRLLADVGEREHHLELGAVALAQPGEAELAGVAQEDHPAGDRDLLAGVVVGLELLGVVRRPRSRASVWVRGDRRAGTARTPCVEQPLALLPAYPHLLGQVVALGVRRPRGTARPSTSTGQPRVVRAWRTGYGIRTGPRRLRPRSDQCTPARGQTGLSVPEGQGWVALEDEAQTVEGQLRLVVGDRRAGVDDRVGAGHRWPRPRAPSHARARRRIRATTPSTWPAKPKTTPDCSASTVFFAITSAGGRSSTWRSCAPRAAERLEGDLDAGRDRTADVLARAG